MPLKKIHRLFFGKIPSVSTDEAMTIFKRDHYKCQYCGLDGMSSFENWLQLTVDHIRAYAKGGSLKSDNQVTACQPCNTIKGTKDFKTLADARKYVQEKREEWRALYNQHAQSTSRAKAAHAR